MYKTIYILCAFCFIHVAYAHYCTENLSGLNLDEAWNRVLANSPQLAAKGAEIQMGQALVEQASLLPNPIFEIDAENLGVNERDVEAEPPQVTYALTQLIELGGKRRARTQLAASEMATTFWERQVFLNDLRLDFLKSFITVAYAQEKLKLAHKQEEVASYLLQALSCQIQEGRISPIKYKKGQIDCKSAKHALQQAESELLVAKNVLAAFWGGQVPDFCCVLYDFFCPNSPPALCASPSSFTQTADFALAHSFLCTAKREYQLQQACRIPDVSLTVGVRSFQHSHEHGWIVGIQFPLPCFNPNRGNIQKAYCGITQANYLLEQAIRELEENRHILSEKLCAGYQEAQYFKNEILPDAYETVDLTKRGYELGKIDYFELLDSQKILYEIEGEYIDNLYTYHLNCAQLMRLTGIANDEI